MQKSNYQTAFIEPVEELKGNIYGFIVNLCVLHFFLSFSFYFRFIYPLRHLSQQSDRSLNSEIFPKRKWNFNAAFYSCKCFVNMSVVCLAFNLLGFEYIIDLIPKTTHWCVYSG